MSEAKQPGHQSANSSTLIYVVDDEAMLLELAKVILTPIGYQVQTFRDPEAALQSYAKAAVRPDLIITDYSMHNMTGMDLITECKRLKPSQKILLVSGTVGAEVFVHAPVKPDCFLPKPYEIRQFTETVHSLLAT
jgi:CheY-like chemotaxis protein